MSKLFVMNYLDFFLHFFYFSIAANLIFCNFALPHFRQLLKFFFF